MHGPGQTDLLAAAIDSLCRPADPSRMLRISPLLVLLLTACTASGGDDTGAASSTDAPTSVTGVTGVTSSTGDAPPTTSTADDATGASTTGTSAASTDADPSSSTTTATTTTATTTTATTAADDGSTGAPVDPNVNVDPSMGMGGAIAPGTSGLTPLGAEIFVPANYDPGQLASPVIWLFNEKIEQWTAASGPDAAILVDLHEYNDTNKIVAKLNETIDVLELHYNVDRGRYYWAGWSAGGNLVVIIGSQNQDALAGTMVFPGTGGGVAQQALADWQGHKIRMYYACGSADPNFDANAVEFEASTWKQQYGYTTRFDLIEGAPHYLDEATYQVRAAAWAWMRGYTLEN